MDAAGKYIRNFEQEVSDFIKSRCLLAPEVPVIVALSGGADSVALLAVMTRLGYNCLAAHCNFRLRGAESERDCRHCMDITAQLGVDLLVRNFDVAARMEATGESTEMACRELRYAWFREIADSTGAQAIAVGHHREDRAETFFINLMRGAGITGLTSMNVRAGDVVRPLLQMSRAQIEKYLQCLGLEFVTDSSNAENDFRRNRLRNIILPELETQFPGAMDSILRSISHLESARVIFHGAIEQYRGKYVDGADIDVASIAALPQGQTVLYEILRPLNFTFDQTVKILSGIHGSGLRFTSTDGRLVAELSRGTLSLYDSDSAALCRRVYPVSLLRDITVPVHIALSRHNITEFKPERDYNTAYFDQSFAHDPANRWELRHYRRGDRLIPFGSNYSKLVSDLFSDAKYDAAQKRNAWILTCNGEIAWIPGLRNTAIGCVNPDSRAFVKLKIITDHEQ